MELLWVHAGGDHLRQVGVKVSVLNVLTLGLLAAAGHHQAGGGQGRFLGGNAAVKAVVAVQLFGQLAEGQQPSLFFTAKGMARKNQGNTQAPLQLGPHPTGIGVVGMDPVWAPLLQGNMQHQAIH